MELELRQTSPVDTELLYRVYASSRDYEMSHLDWGEDQKKTFLTMQFKAQDLDYRKRYPNARFDLIVGDGERIGRLYVDRRVGEIRILDICVLPEHRNQGLGASLIRDLVHEAKETEKSLGIHVESYNPSRRLFERLGFQVTKEDGPLLFLECNSLRENAVQPDPVGKAPIPSQHPVADRGGNP